MCVRYIYVRMCKVCNLLMFTESHEFSFFQVSVLCLLSSLAAPVSVYNLFYNHESSEVLGNARTLSNRHKRFVHLRSTTQPKGMLFFFRGFYFPQPFLDLDLALYWRT